MKWTAAALAGLTLLALPGLTAAAPSQRHPKKKIHRVERHPVRRASGPGTPILAGSSSIRINSIGEVIDPPE